MIVTPGRMQRHDDTDCAIVAAKDTFGWSQNGALDQSVKSNQHYGIIFGAYRERTSQSAMFTVAQYTEYIFVL